VQTLTVDRAGQLIEVVLVEVGPGDAVETLHQVSRAGRPFAVVISAELDDPGVVLGALSPGRAEIVCCDSVSDPSLTGTDLAWRALEKFGVGQDFAFTVPDPADALDYTVNSVADRAAARWEAEFVAVVGSSQLLRIATASLTS
jgi:hypothetical protein